MTKIETLVKLIDQSSINCHGIFCRECPFCTDPEQLCDQWENETARREALKQMIIDAVDEAREEETSQKKPISESLQQEDCKKRGFLQPSHETPEHYKLDPEPIAVIKAWGLGFCLGNVVKYIARAGHKDGESRDSDLHKAMEYLRMELEDEGK